MQQQKIIKEREIRDLSREAMRSLLRFAQAKVESGVAGSLPLDEVQKAKDFFFFWKRRKPFEKNKTIWFFMNIAILFFSFNSTISDFLTFFLLATAWGIYAFLEYDKRKIVYVREMLGDLSGLEKNERDFFLRGLVHELWKIEREDFRKVLFGVSFGFVAVFVGLALFLDLPTDLKRVTYTLAVVASMFYFSNDTITVKKDYK